MMTALLPKITAIALRNQQWNYSVSILSEGTDHSPKYPLKNRKQAISDCSQV